MLTQSVLLAGTAAITQTKLIGLAIAIRVAAAVAGSKAILTALMRAIAQPHPIRFAVSVSVAGLVTTESTTERGNRHFGSRKSFV
jgi:hypothetical protein